MSLTQSFIRLSLATALLVGLSACTIVPAHPSAYRAPPVYVETYPSYRAPPPTIYYEYESNHRHYDDRRGNYYREERRDDRRYNERRYRDKQQFESPLESAARTHRNIRRSLGLPRLPGMP